MVKMRVYYNNNNRITGFSKHEDPAQGENKYSLFPLEEVEDFIFGKKSASQYKIVEHPKTKKTKIQELGLKDIGITVRSLDTILTQVPVLKKESEDADLYIFNNVKAKTLKIKLDDKHKKDILSELEDDVFITINGISRIDFFFTTKDDPSFLVEHITLSIHDLILNKNLSVKYLQDLNSCSLFTKRLYNDYEYIIRN